MQEFTCDECGTSATSAFSRSRFCSDACRYRWKCRNRDPRRPVTYGTCFCGTSFGGRHGETLCRKHRTISGPMLGPSWDDLPIFGPDIPEVLFIQCRSCERIVERVGRYVSYCSETCFNIHHGRMRSECPIEYATCTDNGCGRVYVVDPRKHRSAGCCPEHTTRITRRRRKRADRARKRGQIHEPYTLREIAERDGWRCHLCGGKVPDRPYTAHDNDATIDHLIPQSHGGDDVRSNVALAHNRCNWERGDKGLAQLRLTG